ncbi:3-oxoacyl-ACP synthase III family protein [Flavobacterium sp. CF136]|uniref:3-oxoacyl-ACP synthase III family protein n=1 Tax=Flavobacterium sp. (strain CF136) TaxID=1144313 RepID=UPI0002715227|nr:ketoacyl-ACP synthase III [Flavobacterium sp. CF136]EJL66738.1 3-oxoacyl-(acyl-carrier-protein) synthase III [Flavobacterium sp. CF136]
MFQEFLGVEIEAISACVPKRKILNNSFGELLSPKEYRVFEKTVGILERRWAEENVTASDLGYAAALDLINKYEVNREDVECLIFLSQTPDYKIPFTSNILQHRLELKKEILCLDINAGCAGFIQGLSTAFSIATSLKKGKILFIVAETLSKILSIDDRSTAMLFGDGAAAVLINSDEAKQNKAYFNFFSDGRNADAIKIPDGGYRNGITNKSLEIVSDELGNKKNNLHLSMNGPKVFDFTLREISNSITELLNNAKVKKEDVNYFLLHQSNQFIIKQIASQLQVDQEKMLINIRDFGNTSGVSIPLLICSNKEILKDSKNILLSGYGSGLNWGNLIIDLSNTEIFNIIEI